MHIRALRGCNVCGFYFLPCGKLGNGFTECSTAFDIELACHIWELEARALQQTHTVARSAKARNHVSRAFCAGAVRFQPMPPVRHRGVSPGSCACPRWLSVVTSQMSHPLNGTQQIKYAVL